jgi:hypothetical protein
MVTRIGRGRRSLYGLAVVAMALSWFAIAPDYATAHDGDGRAGGLSAVSEPNDLRWDISAGVMVRWESVEVSARLTNGADANSVCRTLTISAKMAVPHIEGVVGIDATSPQVLDLRDGEKKVIQRIPDKSRARFYDESLSSMNGSTEDAWLPFTVTCLLTQDANQNPLTAISYLKAYIYVLCAERTINVDVPFDPDAGLCKTPADPNILVYVDPTMPPRPGPLKSIILSGDPSDRNQQVVTRPATAVPLYKYRTWVRTRRGTPVMVAHDVSHSCLRDLYPLGDYVLVRTELYASKAEWPYTLISQQWALSDPTGVSGAQCWGQSEQGLGDPVDSIRHVVAVHPVELKIPFIIENIPIPSVQAAAEK